MTTGELAGRAADRLGRRSVDVGHQTRVQASSDFGRHGLLGPKRNGAGGLLNRPDTRVFAFDELQTGRFRQYAGV
jgi:hypothetical protein